MRFGYWLLGVITSFCAHTVLAEPAQAQGTIKKSLNDPVAIYSEDGRETARVKGAQLNNLAAREKGLSWLVITLDGKLAMVRRGDVLYDSAATECVPVASSAKLSGVQTAGSRAGTNAGAGAGGSVCIPKGH